MNFTHNTSLNPTFLQLFFVAKDLFLCPSAETKKIPSVPYNPSFASHLCLEWMVIFQHLWWDDLKVEVQLFLRWGDYMCNANPPSIPVTKYIIG